MSAPPSRGLGHTAGKWSAEVENCGGGLNITADGKRIAHTAEYRDKTGRIVTPPEAFANARLIASAPALAATLERWARWAEQVQPGRTFTIADVQGLVSDTHAALRAAWGGA